MIFNSLSSLQIVEIVALTATTIYHQIASYLDRNYTSPPGKLVTTFDRKVRHLYTKGTKHSSQLVSVLSRSGQD